MLGHIYRAYFRGVLIRRQANSNGHDDDNMIIRSLSRIPLSPPKCYRVAASCRLRSYYSTNTYYDEDVPPFPDPAAVDIEALRRKLISRVPRMTWDVMHPTNSHLLNLALAGVIPKRYQFSHFRLPDGSRDTTDLDEPLSQNDVDIAAWFLGKGPEDSYRLPPGHHFVYFPLQLAANALCPDGTDPFPSPGGPWTRRLWAGGALSNLDGNMLRLRGGPAVCAEHIESVTALGLPGREKIFVEIVREYHDGSSFLRQWRPRGERKPIVERRRLVFMRGQSAEEALEEERTRAVADHRSGQTLRIKPPTFTVTITPTQTLLFQYSALSHNAHHLHLDRERTLKTEGHRNLLVHGPLSVTLILAIVGARKRVANMTYRHLAPLYVDERMKICVRRQKRKPPPGTGKEEEEGEEEKEEEWNWDAPLPEHPTNKLEIWDVWIENLYGTLCVRGVVETSGDRAASPLQSLQ
ncbi:hypothetical protein F4810DRAFT_675150 [Camillea tinctor]|nr:hypothetical protein F4810DRAFT_675150 [Camillea tinctor]